MHYTVFQTFDQIVAMLAAEGPVLEVGAVPGCESLLQLPALKAVKPKLGLNISGGGKYGDYEILTGNANHMTFFEDGRFSLVLCNSTLEHDPKFWKTLGEIRRVTCRRGWIVIGVPGYSKMSDGPSTPTLGLHQFPGDYYRFSEQAVKEILMEGLKDVCVQTVLIPPRFIAWGRKQ